MSDPKLKAAAAEIRAVMQKYDCGGIISLTSKTHGELAVEIPQWTGLSLDDNTDRIQFSSKESEIGYLTSFFIRNQLDTLMNYTGLFMRFSSNLSSDLRQQGGHVSMVDPNDK